MITQYLIEYGYPAALAVFVIAGIALVKVKHTLPGLIIALSTSTMLALRIMHEISFSQDMVSYINDEHGNMIAANIQMTPWQNASLIFDPLGLLLASLSLLLLACQPRKNISKATEQSASN